MISVEEALEKVLSFVKVLDGVKTPILECLGQVLDEDIFSAIDIPPKDNSAMDGYAVKSKDIAGASASSPVYLDIIGEAKAGGVSKLEVKAHKAVRIMTGAPLPKGADTVVPFEETDETQRAERPLKQIGILKSVDNGKNVRFAGEDIASGQLALSRGTMLRPAQIGVLASLGLKTVKAIRRPVVAVLATGDELVEVGKPLREGQIYNSNSYSAAAQVLRYGGIPRVLGIARDTEKDLEANYDLVKDVLAAQGKISFWKVRMKPGKPLAFGTIKGVPHLGLPGNPVSSMITFELFARPAMLKMMGKTNLIRPTVDVIMESDAKNNDGRRVFLRAIVRQEGDRLYAKTTGPQGSGILTSMSLANALVIVPESVAAVKKGDTVKAMMLDWNEE
jgi:molybdopterin molybdotransferase